MRKSGQIDVNGTLQVDVVKSHLPTDQDINLDACLVINGEDKCERALRMQRCVAKSLREQVRNLRRVCSH